MTRYIRNVEKSGIEIYFDTKPDDAYHVNVLSKNCFPPYKPGERDFHSRQAVVRWEQVNSIGIIRRIFNNKLTKR